MAITREQAMSAREFHITGHRGRPCDSKNGPIRWRRNGKTQTWVRKPTAFRVPVKHGLFTYDYIDERALTDNSIHALEFCPVEGPRDANGCLTLPDGDCVSTGPCIHTAPVKDVYRHHALGCIGDYEHPGSCVTDFDAPAGAGDEVEAYRG